MFFPERIKAIGGTDRVLDIGPGAQPHPRATVFLEKRFETEQQARGQRGHAPALADPARTVYYDGSQFPFADHEFDYVICSHVLEHVPNVEAFVAEVTRVAKRGYMEFPTIYYDYVYDFPEHVTFLLYRDATIHWMPKSESRLSEFAAVTRLFYASMVAGHTGFVDALKEKLFQGFEWSGTLRLQREHDISALTYSPSESVIAPAPRPRRSLFRRLGSRIKRTVVR